jgi:hypothetical protein
VAGGRGEDRGCHVMMIVNSWHSLLVHTTYSQYVGIFNFPQNLVNINLFTKIAYANLENNNLHANGMISFEVHTFGTTRTGAYLYFWHLYLYTILTCQIIEF